MKQRIVTYFQKVNVAPTDAPYDAGLKFVFSPCYYIFVVLNF